MVAAGSGSRFGGAKQLERLGGRRVVEHSLATARSVCDGVVLVHHVDHDPADLAPAPDHATPGGATRSASVRAGLAAVPAAAEVVVVHDAARPLASPALFRRVVSAVVDGAAAAVPGVPVADTLKRVDEAGAVAATVDRTALVGVQTPQAFRADALRAAHDSGDEATDDAALVEAAGGRVVVVDGEVANRKITEPDDLVLARRLVGGGLRTGHGFDSHGRGDAGELVLGGLRWPGEPALVGHSDGDAVCHAIIDALLGAAGMGDIGSWFPDTDSAHAGADSARLLAEVVGSVSEAGWVVGHVDCTVVAASPKIAPRRDEMCDRLAAIVGATVSVKGKRPEGFGEALQGGSVAVWAVATLERR